MDNVVSSIVFILIIGGIIGYFIGYLIKKISNFALIIGVFAFLLMYMVYTNSISLNFDELIATVKRFTEILTPLGLTTLASSAPFAGSFVLGLVFGLRRG
ncbi:MAG: FUN14 domain-containing protein [Candidatus Bathyarchaeia archaeon]